MPARPRAMKHSGSLVRCGAPAPPRGARFSIDQSGGLLEARVEIFDHRSGPSLQIFQIGIGEASNLGTGALD